jgi:glutathione gamma-glutamylcysteinyltransferase
LAHREEETAEKKWWNGNGGFAAAVKHCETCTCDAATEEESSENKKSVAGRDVAPCGAAKVEQHPVEDLPEPAYSVRRRVMPVRLTALNSAEGRRRLLDCLAQNTASPYIPLTEHWTNQSHPALCGVTTLLCVLNASAVDPGVRWRGGWRYFGDEAVLLRQCPCLSAADLHSTGMTCDQFQRMAVCQGLRSVFKRPAAATARDGGGDRFTVDDFRRDVASVATQSEGSARQLVVSFDRSSLGQTGIGHFSPIAAYHSASDSCLVLDVARFKYPPYWVSVEDLYAAMLPADEATGRSRGWYVVEPPHGTTIASEDRRPASATPLSSDRHPCPAHPIKVEYCRNRQPRDREKG